MSELKINTLLNVPKINTKATNSIKEKSEPPKSEESDSSATKIVMSGLAAAGVITAAIFALRKGQAAKALKEVGVDKFKEAGNKFIKGKAFTSSGEPFTGVISQITKNGSKKQMHYVDGVLQEVKTYSIIKATTGKILHLPLSKKTYKYAESGKLESVDKFSWMHLNTIDSKQHGFQYVNTSNINLDEKRAQGLKEFAKRQAEAIEKAKLDRAESWKKNASEKIDAVRQQMSQNKDINSGTIDSSFNNFERNKELNELKDYYRDLEEKSIKDSVSKLKEQMHKKPEITAQTIDEQFAQNKNLQEMNEYYRGLEQKEQSIKENVSKLKEHMHTRPEVNAHTIDRQYENTGLKELSEKLALEEKYADRIISVKNKLKGHLTQAECDELTILSPPKLQWFDENGLADKKLIDSIRLKKRLGLNPDIFGIEEKTGNFFINTTSGNRVFFENGKWTEKEIQNFKDSFSRLHTPKGSKIKIHKNGTISFTTADSPNTKTVLSNGSSDSYKISTKNKKGKYEPVLRVTDKNVKDPVDGLQWSQKTVEHMDDGLTRVSYTSEDKSLVLVRDKKGRILDVVRSAKTNGAAPNGSTPAAGSKMLTEWYKEYLQLCKEYGLSPREVKYWDHYRELRMRKYDPKAYESYIRLRDYRSRYDENAARLRYLDEVLVDSGAFDLVQSSMKYMGMDFDYKIARLLSRALENGDINKGELCNLINRLKHHQSSVRIKDYQDLIKMVEHYRNESRIVVSELRIPSYSGYNYEPARVLA